MVQQTKSRGEKQSGGEKKAGVEKKTFKKKQKNKKTGISSKLTRVQIKNIVMRTLQSDARAIPET